MSTTARLSLIGMYNFDPTIFDDLVLPELYDKADFVNSLLLSQGEKRVMYTDIDFMKLSIQVWGKKWFANLERIADALTEEYNPLHNYDRHEEYTDTETYGSKKSIERHEGRSGETHEGRSGETHEGRSTESHTGHSETVENTTDLTTERTVSAMNSSTYEPDNQEYAHGKVTDQSTKGTFNGHGQDTTNGSTSEVLNGSNSETMNGSGVDSESRNNKLVHNAHLYGNIGVTTSVQMLLEEINARAYNNMYDIAIEIFARELLLYVY